jgi:hypothetical protein
LYFPEAKLYAGWNRYKTKNYLGIFWILGAGELNTEYAMQWGQIAGFFWVPFFRKSQKGFVFNNVKIHFLWWINFTKEHELKIINKDNKRRFTHKPMYLTNTNNSQNKNIIMTYRCRDENQRRRIHSKALKHNTNTSRLNTARREYLTE